MKEATSIDQLLLTLSDKTTDEQERWEAAQTLGTLSDMRAVEPLRAALDDPSAPIRYNAALSLGNLGAGQAAPDLLAVLRRLDENEDVTQAAGLALAQLDPSILDLLIEALHNQEEPIVLRYYTAGAIGEVGSPRRVGGQQPGQSQKALLALWEANQENFNWGSPSVRAGIVQGFGALGEAGATSAVVYLLEGLLEDTIEDVAIRCEAAWSLGRVGSDHSRQVLLDFMPKVEAEGNEILRQNIEAALKLEQGGS